VTSCRRHVKDRHKHKDKDRKHCDAD
jgi:hypothetical protein